MKKEYKNSWLTFYPKFDRFQLKLNIGSYFDSRLELVICLGWGLFFIDFPFKTKYDECDPPTYGIYYYMNGLVFCYGKKKKTFYMPWDYDWVRTSYLKKDGTWEHETKRNRKDFYHEKWNNVFWRETYSYRYYLKPRNKEHKSLTGKRCLLIEKHDKETFKIQDVTATIKVEEMEWRWRWFKRFKFTSMIKKSISVDFSDEVGGRSGSWKGGTVGCSYAMLKDETPLDTLRRMEKEREF